MQHIVVDRMKRKSRWRDVNMKLFFCIFLQFSYEIQFYTTTFHNIQFQQIHSDGPMHAGWSN